MKNRYSILLVEKDQAHASEIREVIDAANEYEVMTAKTLEQAMLICSQQHFDLLVTNHWGEERDNFIELKNILPTLMVTDKVQSEAFIKNHDSLVTCCLDYSEVKDRLQTALHKAIERFRLDLELEKKIA